MSEAPENQVEAEPIDANEHIDVEDLGEMPVDVAGEEIVAEVIEEVVETVDDDLGSEIVVDDGELIYAEEEVAEGYIEAFGEGGLLNLNSERNILFDIYQPHETSNGTYVCKICLRAAKTVEYPDRPSFVAHRYKCHGSFNNNVICPMEGCREVYASLFTLRRHLSQQHGLPLEIHTQSFMNIGEFEKTRHLIEIAYGCRYMMHTKQPKYRRQVMHCAKSEHKLVLQTQKHRLPREKMHKEGSACPSVISYRVDPQNGQVHTFMQLFHTGHNPDTDAAIAGSSVGSKPMDIVFPIKPSCFAGECMQYVQIDVLEMPTAVYGSKMYETMLVVTCLKSRFMWAKPMFECTRTAIGRILNSIFNEYGVPEGFSTTYMPTYIRDTMKSLESVYAVEIREIWSEPAPYPSLEQWLLEMSEQELGTRNRWVEQIQFVVMEYNQKAIPERTETPFERMFNRKPPNLYSNGEEPDSLASKYRRHHLELRREDGEVDPSLNTTFKTGDKVYLRKGITKPRRGNNTQYYFGWIGEVDANCKFFPYKVHFSSNDSPWPSERNMFVWSSVFDLLPTTHTIREMDYAERHTAISRLLCKCSGKTSHETFDLSALGHNAQSASKCPLMRNENCSNLMSKFCCKMEGRKTCRFHDLYPDNDESYTKMEQALVNFQQQNKIVASKILKELENDAPLHEMLQEEIQRRRLAGEDITLEDVIEEAQTARECPPLLEREHVPAPDEAAEERRRPVKVLEPIEGEDIDDELLIPEEGDVAFQYGEDDGPVLRLQNPHRQSLRRQTFSSDKSSAVNVAGRKTTEALVSHKQKPSTSSEGRAPPQPSPAKGTPKRVRKPSQQIREEKDKAIEGGISRNVEPKLEEEDIQDEPPRKKKNTEDVPSTSSEGTEGRSRRASQRKTARPKNLSDYVE